MFGYDTGIIGAANLYIYDDLGHHETIVEETVVSLTILGAALGALFGGPTADRFGRKRTLIIADFLFLSGSIGMALAPSI